VSESTESTFSNFVPTEELDGGIQWGKRVVCYPDNPEEGTIKWLGKINQIIYIGVEFVITKISYFYHSLSKYQS